MRQRKCGEKIICVDGACFLTVYDAGKYLMQVAARRQPVRISHRRDWSSCLLGEGRE